MARCLARVKRVDRLANERTRQFGVFLQVVAQRGPDELLDGRLDLGVAQPHLGLALELRLGDLDADNRRQTPTEVVAGRDGVFPEQILALGVEVERARQRRLESA